MTVTVITPDGEPGHHDCEPLLPSWAIAPPGLEWNGRDSAGAVVPDGLYKLRVHLRHQTITLPNTILVDTTPPAIAIKRVVPRVFSPDHDGRREYVTISFGVSATARPLLYVGRRQVGRGRLTRTAGSIHWYGGVHGETYPPGVYRLSLRAEDRAGNISPPTSDVRVAIRYLTLGRKVVRARAGKRFALRVASDAKSVQWLLRGKSGEGPPGDAAHPRAEEAGAVQALRHLERPLSGRARGRLEVTAELARAGGPIGCAGLALLLLATRRDLRLAGLGLLALGALFLLAYLARPVIGRCSLPQESSAWSRWPAAPGSSCAGRGSSRSPRSLASLRASRSSWATESANLLIPLYAVVVAAGLALAWRLVRGDERNRELGPLAWPLAAFVAWSGLSLAWSGDLRQGAITLLFFFLPFGLLAVVLARLPWSRRWLEGVYGLLGLMAVVFAFIGLYQWVNRDVFWNPKVIVANAYAPSGFFYRVNSVFYDPSIYGRFLVLAILASSGDRPVFETAEDRDLAHGRDRRDLGGPVLLLFPVELRDARGRRPRRRRVRLAPTRGRRHRAGRCAPACGRRHERGDGRAERGPEPRLERPVQAGHQWIADRARAPGAGCGDRRVQAGVRRSLPPEGQGTQEGRVTRHAGDGGRRGRPPGTAAPRLAVRRGDRRRVARGIVLVPRADEADPGTAVRLDRRPQPLLQRVLRRPDDVGGAGIDRAGGGDVTQEEPE